MDCEKFDQVLIDALYDELDELTLAAAKRHADGCPRCQAAWLGLKATRKIGILPLVEAPAGIEERVLAAAREAHRDVAWPKRLGRAISWAGSYAMRPQTAMAAILLLMLGSSVIFVRAKPDRGGTPSRVHVTERGVPENAVDEPHAAMRPMAAVAPSSALDDRPTVTAAPAATALAMREPAEEAERKVARADKSEGFSEPPATRRARAIEPMNVPSEGPSALDRAEASGSMASSEQAVGGAARAVARPAPVPAKDAYASAMELYNAGQYVEAEKAFHQVAASSSKSAPQAALFAAKSAEAGFGCGKAAPMYEAAASRYGATTPGAEALWAAANCYKAIGSLDKATVFYNELRKVAGYRDRAEGELASLRTLQQERLATRKAAAAKAAAPAAPAAAPPSTAAPPPTSNAERREP